tara:strand:- start:10862 stop:11890 length:1029 start_codon:yes stop_codon:yes gene_type:complete
MPVGQKKKDVNFNLCEEDKKIVEKYSTSDMAKYRGFKNEQCYEGYCDYLAASSEKVYSHDNNQFIILGRDRHGPRDTGYGGKGHTQSGKIDIVVGLGGPYAEDYNCDAAGNRLELDPLFHDSAQSTPAGRQVVSDSARIYLSQKTNIDEAFGLKETGLNAGAPSLDPRSGIGIKADTIRVIGKEGVSIRTSPMGISNSLGGLIESVKGIDLVAGDITKELEPMVKGHKLIEAFEKLTENLDTLSGIVAKLVLSQIEFNAKLMSHQHDIPLSVEAAATLGMAGAKFITLPSRPVLHGGMSAQKKLMGYVSDLTKWKMNINGWLANYTSRAEPGYINSKFNNVN